MEQGKVTQYSAGDGYGVVHPDDGKPDIRVLASEAKEPGSLARGRRVEYEVVHGPKGPEATDVHRA